MISSERSKSLPAEMSGVPTPRFNEIRKYLHWMTEPEEHN
jgi:hypothetical protein